MIFQPISALETLHGMRCEPGSADQEILTQSYEPPACDLWSFGVVVCLDTTPAKFKIRRYARDLEMLNRLYLDHYIPTELQLIVIV